ncbi:hypothetical protein BGZ97_008505 [Linnemannia gamsii]|uniref:Uncharacterized protein n=1 Tax=Linnemannia gamsii TaxID=64522 RepID=A0A9P6RBL5_9FUNG|nr:hypothetical protein BGZ97_008505 [Linnemannia gamsii]
MRILTAPKELSSAVYSPLSPKTTANSIKDAPNATNHTKDASNINNNTVTNCFAILLKSDQRRLKDDGLEAVWNAELAKTLTDLDTAVKLISRMAAPKAKLAFPTQSGDYSYQRHLPFHVRSDKFNYSEFGYKDTKYMSCIPISIHREKAESKPQRPPRVLCEDTNYMVLPSTRSRSKMTNHESQPFIPSHYNKTKSQPFTQTFCNKRDHMAYRIHPEHGKCSVDFRASKASSPCGVAIDIKHLDTVTRGTGAGVPQLALNSTNDSDCELSYKTAIQNDTTVQSTDSRPNIHPTNKADSHGKRPNNTSNFFATRDYRGNIISPPVSFLNWLPNKDDDIDTADFDSPLTTGPHDIDSAIYFIVAGL